MKDLYNIFKKYEVKADSVKDFLEKYYKKDRYKGHEEELLKSYTEEFKKEGFCFISHHDSITGECVAWYGN